MPATFATKGSTMSTKFPGSPPNAGVSIENEDSTRNTRSLWTGRGMGGRERERERASGHSFMSSSPSQSAPLPLPPLSFEHLTPSKPGMLSWHHRHVFSPNSVNGPWRTRMLPAGAVSLLRFFFGGGVCLHCRITSWRLDWRRRWHEDGRASGRTRRRRRRSRGQRVEAAVPLT